MADNVVYQWHEETMNFCLWKNGDFIRPLKPLKLSEVDKEGLRESLQTIYFQRTGQINYGIGLSYEKDVALAKQMGCWD